MNIIQVLRQYDPKSMERRGINLRFFRSFSITPPPYTHLHTSTPPRPPEQPTHHSRSFNPSLLFFSSSSRSFSLSQHHAKYIQAHEDKIGCTPEHLDPLTDVITKTPNSDSASYVYKALESNCPLPFIYHQHVKTLGFDIYYFNYA
jgi:hypothetical protein